MSEVKTTTVQFDSLKTLAVISANPDLQEVFNNKSGVEVGVAVSMVNSNSLTKKVTEVLQGMFENVIVNRESFLQAYNEAEGLTTDEVKDSIKVPRRWGKQDILSDIEANDGNKTEVHRLGLANNDLKNTYLRLEKLVINERFKDANKVSEKEMRDLIGAINTLIKKTDQITGRKK